MLGFTGTDHMTDYERKVRRALWSFAVYSTVAIIVLLFSFTEALKPSDEQFATWFQRAGAPMTIFALIAQSRVSRLRDLLTPNTFSTQEFNNILLKYRKYRSIGNAVSLFLVIIGTIIWAYGDIFYKQICH